MKELESKDTPAVVGGAAASPYPVPGSTPPYVPIMPAPNASDPLLDEAAPTTTTT